MMGHPAHAHKKHTSGVKTPLPKGCRIAGDKSPPTASGRLTSQHPRSQTRDLGHPASRMGHPESGLVVLAFPFGVGALEVFYVVFVKDPKPGGYFVDQVVVVSYQQDCAFVTLEGYVEGVDGFEVEVVGGSSKMRMLGLVRISLQKARRACSPPLRALVCLSPSSPEKSIWPRMPRMSSTWAAGFQR